MRITARYSAFGLYETAILGMLSQSTGWATAARHIVDVAAIIDESIAQCRWLAEDRA